MQRIGSLAPEVPVADDRDSPRVRSPDREPHPALVRGNARRVARRAVRAAPRRPGGDRSRRARVTPVRASRHDGDHVGTAGREPDEIPPGPPAEGRVGEQVERRERGRQPQRGRHDAEPFATLAGIEVDDGDHDVAHLRASRTRSAPRFASRARRGSRTAAERDGRAGSRSAAGSAAAAARRASASSPRTSPSRGTPRFPRAPARSRRPRSPSRSRSSGRAWRRARAWPRTPDGHLPGGTRGGCRACSATCSAGRTPTSERACSTNSTSSAFVFFQVKYVYDWLKPTLASVVIGAGRVKASARKIAFPGYAARTSPISHSQNGTGFVCGLSTRNTRIPRAHQPSTTSRSAFQSASRSSVSQSRLWMST